MDKKKILLSLAAITTGFSGVKVAKAEDNRIPQEPDSIQQEANAPGSKGQFVLRVNFNNPEMSDSVFHTSHRSHSSHTSHKSHSSHSSHRSTAFV